jgi:hypothetical protein
MQLALCKLSYCDFIVWTSKDYVVERISADKHFLESKQDVLKYFFVYGMMPEIVGKWYTRKPIADLEGVVSQPLEAASEADASSPDEEEDYTKLWCYCNQPSFGNMVKCDNDKCTIEWFHFDCLCMRCPPKGKWYCPSCRKMPKFSKRKKK